MRAITFIRDNDTLIVYPDDDLVVWDNNGHIVQNTVQSVARYIDSLFRDGFTAAAEYQV